MLITKIINLLFFLYIIKSSAKIFALEKFFIYKTKVKFTLHILHKYKVLNIKNKIIKITVRFQEKFN